MTRHITLCIRSPLPPPDELTTGTIPKIRIPHNIRVIKSHAYIPALADTHNCLIPPILHQPIPARGECVAREGFREPSVSYRVLDGKASDDFLQAPVLSMGEGGDVDQHPVSEALGGKGGDGGVEWGIGAVLGWGV